MGLVEEVEKVDIVAYLASLVQDTLATLVYQDIAEVVTQDTLVI